ncbi:MAG TPA: Rieske 2Fe-2S domain-containing protein [Acetobacteraceae bacterium]
MRRDGHQILLVHSEAGVFACTSRCPHEGYPLSEGTLTDGCVLTCNWHNWKFNLASGETLVGGDRLTRFPVRLENGRVLLDLTPPDPAQRRTEILAGVVRGLEDLDQQRLVREIARLIRLRADPADAVRTAIGWAAERLEFGMTHAFAGAADWLRLFDRPASNEDERLAALGEILGHIADDAQGGGHFPFPAGTAAWNEAAFLDAMEREDEAAAIAMLRGALGAGATPDDLLPALAAAALAHYAGFGHSLIYAAKTVELARRLSRDDGSGDRRRSEPRDQTNVDVTEPLLCLAARNLIYARREDLLPEFRDYAARLSDWGTESASSPPLNPSVLRGMAAKSAMEAVAAWGARHQPVAIFWVLVQAAAWNLLHADETVFDSSDGKLADNVGWLDFTHALTFAEAALSVAPRRPGLWPAILLQLACFIGRNAGYVDAELDTSGYPAADADGFLADSIRGLFDHGRDRFIISVHLTKTLLAGINLIQADRTLAPTLTKALDRFLHARIKGRHVLRTARQMRDLVEQE